jgi:protein gp37
VDLDEWLACNCPADYYGWNGNTDAHNHYCPRSRSYVGKRIDWVIVGGESGHNARPMHPDWARSLRDQCQAAGAAYFHKQNGEWAPEEVFPEYIPSGKSYIFDDGSEVWRVGKKAAGRLLDGREWNEFPEVCR